MKYLTAVIFLFSGWGWATHPFKLGRPSIGPLEKVCPGRVLREAGPGVRKGQMGKNSVYLISEGMKGFVFANFRVTANGYADLAKINFDTFPLDAWRPPTVEEAKLILQSGVGPQPSPISWGAQFYYHFWTISGLGPDAIIQISQFMVLKSAGLIVNGKADHSTPQIYIAEEKHFPAEGLEARINAELTENNTELFGVATALEQGIPVPLVYGAISLTSN